MKKVAIILLAIGLISCTLTKKDYKNDEPLPNLAKIKTPKEEAQEEAQEKAGVAVAESVVAAFAGNVVPGAVNAGTIN